MALPVALTSRFTDWLRRPPGPEPTPIRLTQSRIFILPTRGGLLLCATLLLMLLGCVNYDLGLGYILTFLLAGVALVSLLHTFRNLAQLEVRAGRAEPVFAGEEAVFPLLIENSTPLPRTAIMLRPNDALAVVPSATWCHVEALSTERCEVRTATHQRGRLPLPRVRVSTSFPLGLFYAWSYIEPEASCMVYPRPESGVVPSPRPRGGHGEGLQAGHGQDDFAGLIRYTLGDPPRRIAWKAVARGLPTMTKQFTGLEAGILWLRWSDLPADLRLETKLSRMTRWVLDAAGHGLRFGLELPGVTIEPDRGVLHVERCLTALALYRSR